MNITRTDVENYIKKLDEEKKFLDSRDESIIPKLYRQVETAYLLTVHDTLSDDFQIVTELREIFWKYAQRRAELDKEDQ